MSRLIIDITELASWQGKLTGVPRVMYELSTRFLNDDSTLFVVWNGQRQALQKVDFSPDSRDATNSTNPDAEASAQKYATIISKVNKAKQKSRVVRKALIVPEKVARKVLRPNTVPVSDQELIAPATGDTVFVLADWHGSDATFIEYLKRMKKASDKIKLVQISYDMLPIVTPQYSGHATDSFTKYVREIYPICDSIIAISQHTKRDIESYLKGQEIQVPPVSVIRLGDDFAYTEAVKPKDAAFLDAISGKDQFLLCVGTVEARKNHTLLYYTYKLAAEKGIQLPKIIVVGRLGWLSNDVYEVITRDPETKDRFVFMKNTSDEELTWLYEHCLFSVYPSFYEGWGLPVAESISRGVVCVASNTSSIPEIAGDRLQYFSPVSTDECLEKIAGLLDKKALDAARKKIATYELTNWDNTFKVTKAILNS